MRRLTERTQERIMGVLLGIALACFAGYVILGIWT